MPLHIVILYGLVGSFGAVAVIVGLWGFSVYITRLGTERRVESRDEGLDIMEWAVVIMVVVVLLAGLLRYLVQI